MLEREQGLREQLSSTGENPRAALRESSSSLQKDWGTSCLSVVAVAERRQQQASPWSVVMTDYMGLSVVGKIQDFSPGCAV